MLGLVCFDFDLMCGLTMGRLVSSSSAPPYSARLLSNRPRRPRLLSPADTRHWTAFQLKSSLSSNSTVGKTTHFLSGAGSWSTYANMVGCLWSIPTNEMWVVRGEVLAAFGDKGEFVAPAGAARARRPPLALSSSLVNG